MATDAEGVLWVNLGTKLAGERNTGTSNEYSVAVPEGTPTRVTGATETLINATPGLVFSIVLNAGHTGNIELRNASSTGGGSTPIFILDATATELGASFDTGITVKGSVAGSDFTILWRAA